MVRTPKRFRRLRHDAERIKKDFLKIFLWNDLNIVIKCNLKNVDYLDVTFNFLNNTYKPFSKPNNKINYIHKESKCPLSMIKQVPFSIKKIFNEAASIYYFHWGLVSCKNQWIDLWSKLRNCFLRDAVFTNRSFRTDNDTSFKWKWKIYYSLVF